MGLDAVVFCDCVEKGEVKKPHPYPHLLYIAENGAPEIHSEDSAEIEQHDAWIQTACQHEEMTIDGSSLGSATAIEFLRTAVRRAVRAYARDFPLLWKKVIYSGTHTGDCLPLTDVRRLEKEMKRFGKIDFEALNLSTEDSNYIREFNVNLTRLVKSAIRVNKPIAF